MRRSRVVPHEDHVPSSRREHLHARRRRRTRHRTAVAVVAAVTFSSALPAAAADISLVPRDVVGAHGTAIVPAPDDHGARPQATIESAEAWCSYLSSHYLAFPSPWSARVINCRHADIFVAPLFSDGSRGMCVLVPARHSRHLGGNVVRAVVDIRLC